MTETPAINLYILLYRCEKKNQTCEKTVNGGNINIVFKLHDVEHASAWLSFKTNSIRNVKYNINILFQIDVNCIKPLNTCMYHLKKEKFIINNYLFLRHCQEDEFGVLAFSDVTLGPGKAAFQSSLHANETKISISAEQNTGYSDKINQFSTSSNLVKMI